MVAATLVSFGLSAYGTFADRTSAYYLLQSRAWELLLGTLVSLNSFPHVKAAIWRNAASLTGVALVIVSVFCFSLAATRLCWPDFLLALSLALATHRIHENVRALPPRPPRAPHDSVRGFRNNNRCDSLLEVCRSALSKRSRTTVANEAVRDCRCCRCGPRGDWSQCNSLTRSPRPVLDASKYYASYLKYEDKEAMRKGRCFLVPEHSWEDFNFVKCLSTDDMKKDYLLFGDSYAAHLWYGLSVIFREDNFLQATVAGCSPIFDRRGAGCVTTS